MKGKGGLARALLRRFLLLSLAPLFLVGTVAYLLASRSLETRITEYLEEQAYQLSGSVDRILANTSADVSTWAQLSVFKGALLFGSYDKSNKYLSDFKEAYSVYHAIHLYDQNHVRVASSSSETDTILTAEDLDLVLSGKLTVSPVRKGESGFRMVFAAPITNNINQSVSGAIVAELDWDLILALVDEAQRHAEERGHDSYRITLIDGEGRVVADEDHDRVLNSSLRVDGLVESALAGQRGAGYQRFDRGVEVLVGFTPLASFSMGDNQTGACLVTQTAREALAPVTRLGWALMAIAIAATIASIVFARSAARRVVQPVIAASLQARAISRGELSDNIQSNAQDELAELITSLNSMSEELRQIASLADEIAVGKLPRELSPRSHQDRLRHSLQSMTAYIRYMARVAESIADGDLTPLVKPASADDVLGRAFKKMVSSLKALLSEVQSLSNNVASSSAEIAASSEQAARMGEQATSSAERLLMTMQLMSMSVEKIAGQKERASDSSLDQMTKSIKGTADTVERLVILANQASRSTDIGRNAMVEATHSMSEIQSAMGGASEIVEALGTRAANIGQIVAIIEDIAEQTNLLALNAAIEAARAGEHGAGFAVVADEVRKLAERSAGSASEISILIRDIDTRVKKAVSVMTESNSKVDDGIHRTTDMARALQAIDQVVNELNRLITEIESAISIQSTGAEQIADSAHRLHVGTAEVMKTTKIMRDTVSENAHGATQLSDSAQALSTQVEYLNQLVSRFRVEEV